MKDLAEWQVNPPAGLKHKVTENLQRCPSPIATLPISFLIKQSLRRGVSIFVKLTRMPSEHSPAAAPSSRTWLSSIAAPWMMPILPSGSGTGKSVCPPETRHGKSVLEVNEKELGDIEGDEEVNFEDSEDDLLSSQELVEMAKSVGVDLTASQETMGEKGEETVIQKENQVENDKKGKQKMGVQVEGLRRSPRLENSDDMNMTEKAISRAEAKDAFLSKDKALEKTKYSSWEECINLH